MSPPGSIGRPEGATGAGIIGLELRADKKAGFDNLPSRAQISRQKRVLKNPATHPPATNGQDKRHCCCCRVSHSPIPFLTLGASPSNSLELETLSLRVRTEKEGSFEGMDKEPAEHMDGLIGVNLKVRMVR